MIDNRCRVKPKTATKCRLEAGQWEANTSVSAVPDCIGMSSILPLLRGQLADTSGYPTNGNLLTVNTA
jgi:hypothetical protein